MAQERRRRSDRNTTGPLDQVNDRPTPRLDDEAIRQRAYERFRERGGEDGHDLDDWLEAERELSRGVRGR